ncbi:MAG: hypothetical protein IKU93_04670 [Alistipes sp.]|nr:hypothetical protein [Alistipes sp.]
MERLVNILYYLLDLDSTAEYSKYFTAYDPRGLDICFYIMLAVAVGAAAIYYFAIASKVNSATKSNYLWTYIFGWVVLAVFTPLIFQLHFRNDGCQVMDFLLVFVKLGLINILWYTLVYQLCSSLFCTFPWTKAKNITLLTVFK